MNYGVYIDIKDETVENVPKPRIDIFIRFDNELSYEYSLEEFKAILKHYSLIGALDETLKLVKPPIEESGEA